MTKLNQNPYALLTLLLTSLPLLAGGCEEEQEVPPDSGIRIDVDIDDEADEVKPFRTWIGYISEENPPLTCPHSYAVRGFDCDGSYCDNVAMDCRKISGASIGPYKWTPYFSEEGSGTADEGHCWGKDRWMTGVACSGSYCDDLSLRCTQFKGSSSSNDKCDWSNWYSEEHPPFLAPIGYYIKGMECDGSYCDKKRYYHCLMQ